MVLFPPGTFDFATVKIEASLLFFYFMMPLSRGKDQGEREQDFMSAGGIQ